MVELDVNIEEGVLAVGGPGAGEDGRPVQEPPDQGGQVHRQAQVRQAADPTREDARLQVLLTGGEEWWGGGGGVGKRGGEEVVVHLERKAAASMARIQVAMVRVGRSSRESLTVPTRM